MPKPDRSTNSPAMNNATNPTLNGEAASGAVRSSHPSSFNPVRMLIDLFSSIWLGVCLLISLFIYSAIGSSGVPIHPNIFDPAHWVAVRQWRPFELTEFEWFHWWPFNLIIALICINLIVATIRRIPFKLINLGVLMIHSGIVMLAAGSVWYFSTKVEGDAPVNRRRIVAELPGLQPVSFTALPGNRAVIGSGDNAYALEVSNIDPQWELLSGDDKGKKSYKISVTVQSKGGMFMRELIAGRPEYTQDLIRSNDPNQPWSRATKALGKPLVDEVIKLSLDYDPALYFYLMDSHAVYLRELDATGNARTDWVQRPIKDLPRFNDYIASSDDVWQAVGDDPLPISPVRNVNAVAVDAKDPLPSVALNISRFLRYASLETRRSPSPQGPLDPVINVKLNPLNGEPQLYRLVVFDELENAALQNNMQFIWVKSEEQREKLKQRKEPVLRFSVPGTTISVSHPVADMLRVNPDAPFIPIDGTNYSYRVDVLQDSLKIGERVTSVAIVQIKTPQSTFTRWVFDDPSLNRDMAMAEGLAQHEAGIELDKGLESVYEHGESRPPILIVAGPGETDLAVVVTKVLGQPVFSLVKEGDLLAITDGVSMSVEKYAARTITETRPLVVPREQRDRDVRENLSMIKLDLPEGASSTSVWLPYHMYAFTSPDEVLRRFPYRPTTVSVPDPNDPSKSKLIELMFSRARLPLPAPVVLEEFKVASHIGGFTGQTSSITDWTSIIRFAGADGWSQPSTVSVNKPSEFQGYWFFQAQWDPPDQPRFQGDPGSRGLNYTVLGVGNRNGVQVQLAGCCIAVFGMLFAFYAKPIIKRRRQQLVYASAEKHKSRADRESKEPVGAAWKVES